MPYTADRDLAPFWVGIQAPIGLVSSRIVNRLAEQPAIPTGRPLTSLTFTALTTFKKADSRS